MSYNFSRNILRLTCALTCLAASTASADPGVTASTITFGQSAALEGPAAALGQGMNVGILAAFDEANRNGGVAGRKLELRSYDDGYEPNRAIENTRRLIDQDQVFALIGEVGTPTSKAVQPITTEAMVPFIGPFTGAGFLRDASLGNIVNYRATYGQETEAWIKHLTEDLGHKRIAILYQDDSFGRVGLEGVQKALEKRGMSLVAEATYKRNTTAVKSAVLTVRKAKPDSVVMVGAYKPIAAFIKLARISARITRLVSLSSTMSTRRSLRLPDGLPMGEVSRCAPKVATKWNWLPLPGSLSSHSRPFISSTSCDEIVRPSPVPP
jgi:ABC-type branched-subunit amino acid transport system substrate-binding protein